MQKGEVMSAWWPHMWQGSLLQVDHHWQADGRELQLGSVLLQPALALAPKLADHHQGPNPPRHFGLSGRQHILGERLSHSLCHLVQRAAADTSSRILMHSQGMCTIGSEVTAGLAYLF